MEKAGKAELIKECCCVLLSLFAREYFEEKAQTLQTDMKKHFIEHCVEYIKAHFNEDITLSEFVELSAMSKTSFCTMFSSVVGTSFKDFLNEYRIKKAVQFIGEGEKISKVCTKCGYDEFSTFYRNFKKYTKLSPADYKKIYFT